MLRRWQADYSPVLSSQLTEVFKLIADNDKDLMFSNLEILPVSHVRKCNRGCAWNVLVDAVIDHGSWSVPRRAYRKVGTQPFSNLKKVYGEHAR